MTRICLGFAMGSFVLALCSVAEAQPAAGKPPVSLQMAALPDPVRVTLNPAKTAILLMDVIQPICGVQPKCTGQMMPALTPFLARARKAGVVVAYGTRQENMDKWLAPVAPNPSDIKVAPPAQDRFFNTDLDQQFKAKGITTVIMVGWKDSGSVTYTAVGGAARGYTVVVPEDTTTAPTDFETAVGFFQLLNSNSTNAPLKPNATTLSRTDMISFQ